MTTFATRNLMPADPPDEPIVRTYCLTVDTTDPHDQLPATCALVANHDGDHRSGQDRYWGVRVDTHSWPNDEAGEVAA
jgi:hypothetical protein